MNGKGDDVLLKTSRVTEWTLNNNGYLTFVFGGLLIAGCISAYVIAVARGNVDAFLPLISDAAGSPPQNGLFGTLVCLGGMAGVLFMLLRYMIVLEQNQEKSRLVSILNKLALTIGIVSMFGITLITGYPINFYRNKDVWLKDVGLPHMIGGIMLFSFGLIYTAIQCILTLFLSGKNRNLLMTRVAICMVCTACFVYHLVTVPDNFGGMSHLFYVNGTEQDPDTTLIPYPATLGASLKLPIDTSGSYLSSAVTEWILVFFFCGFFFTFFKEMQEYSLLVVIETQMPESESLNDVSSEPNSLRKPSLNPEVSDERRSSDVRTYFRRDSTCQTITDSTDDIVSSKPSFSTFENGRYIKRQVSSFEVLTDNKLADNPLKKSKLEDNCITEEAGTMVNGDVAVNDAGDGQTENAIDSANVTPSGEDAIAKVKTTVEENASSETVKVVNGGSTAPSKAGDEVSDKAT